MKISKNFSLNEFENSIKAGELGIDNTITDQNVIDNIKNLVEFILQPLRNEIDKPIIISSGYRCDALNEVVGGSKTSQHRLGLACDIKCDEFDSYKIACLIYELELPYDQLILYPTFTHISYSINPRKQILYNKSYEGNKIECEWN